MNQRTDRSAVVVGAGIAGVSTAFYLAQRGYRVTCVEKRAEVAQEASFLNGGLVCPSLTLPWPCFGLLKSAVLSLASGDGNVRVRWSNVVFDKLFWDWSANFLYACLPYRLHHNFVASYALSDFSKACMENLPVRPEEYARTAKGTLSLFPSTKSRDDTLRYIQNAIPGTDRCPNIVALNEGECLDTVSVLRHCPENRQPKAGIYSDEDYSGDIRNFTAALAREASALGVRFAMEQEVVDVVTNRASPQRACGVRLGSGETISADVVVIATGNAAPKMARSLLRDRVLQVPVLGYALEVPTCSSKLPRLWNSVVDDTNKVYAAPLNSSDEEGVPSDAVRISGFVEFGEALERVYRPTPKECEHSLLRAKMLLASAESFFPKGFIDVSGGVCLTTGETEETRRQARAEKRARAHVCMRPQTPDDLPIVGPSRMYDNVYYNCGHGHLGWTRAVGSSRLCTRLIVQHQRLVDDAPSHATLNEPVEVLSKLRGLDAGNYRPDRFFFGTADAAIVLGVISAGVAFVRRRRGQLRRTGVW